MREEQGSEAGRPGCQLVAAMGQVGSTEAVDLSWQVRRMSMSRRTACDPQWDVCCIASWLYLVHTPASMMVPDKRYHHSPGRFVLAAMYARCPTW